MPAHAGVEHAASRIAAAIGEPARASMLFALLDGRARTSTELAMTANVSPSTASAHLARLREAGLLRLHVQGRHRYYRIGNRRAAELLERLSVLAGGTRRGAAELRRSTPSHLIAARSCYDHVAGVLGVSLHDALIACGWLESPELPRSAYSSTVVGHRELAALGIDVDELWVTRRRFAFGCLDWSERRPHLAGALGAALLSTMLAKRWVRSDRDSRALSVTALGRRELSSRIGLQLDA
jgi:DNA-binding transcriptional ArsR family regulator